MTISLLPTTVAVRLTRDEADDCAHCGWPLEANDRGVYWEDAPEVLFCSYDCAGITSPNAPPVAWTGQRDWRQRP